MKESNETLVAEMAAAESAAKRRPGPVRRMYNWTIHWAATPYAPWALFVLAFAEASFFPIPPDVLLMAMALGTPRKSLRYSAVCTAGSALGGCFGYLIGLFFFETIGRPLIDLYGAWSIYQSVSEGFQAHGFFWIFTAALTPIPYKVFTIAAGACKISFAVLVAASVIGRGIRFYAVGGLFRIFGAPIKKFIDRYFNLLTVAFVVILVGGFIVVKMLWPKENARPDPQGPRPALEQPVRDYNAPARPEH